MKKTYPKCFNSTWPMSGCVLAYLILLSSYTSKAQGVVDYNGLLKVEEGNIVNQHGETVSFAGNSFFWSNDGWGGEKYYRANVVSWLKKDWFTSIVRASMGVEDAGGYIDNPEGNVNKLTTIVDAAIAEDMYVIIDWHSHHAEDHLEEAQTFFTDMATRYGEYDNVIYEVYNEPLDVSWSEVVKPYAESVIEVIRAIDPDNMIIVGSPEWSQRVDLAAADPITDTNIAYTLHFYSIHHHQWLRDRASEALAAGIALFVTEWGVLGGTFNDPETDAWMQWCLDNNISHCNWAVNDKEEAWSILKPNTGANGEWSNDRLTIAGQIVKQIVRTWPSTIELPLNAGQLLPNQVLFPNPVKDELVVEIGVNTGVIDCQILSVSGRLIFDEIINVPGGQLKLDISNLDSGTYVLKLQGKELQSISKFVKE